MNKVLKLLKEKNFYLERFLDESKKERSRFKARHFDNLDVLYKKREEILANIQSIDKRIDSLCDDENIEDMNLPNKDEMSQLLKQIKDNVHSIMEEDLQIISYIEDEKTKIIQEISHTREGRRVLKGYKAV